MKHEIGYKIEHLINDTYQVIKDNPFGVEYQGSLSDCEAWIRLKELIKGQIPDSVVKRSKQAYRAPISGSFFNEKQSEYVNELLSNESMQKYGIFDSSKINMLLRKIKENQASEVENMALAAILSTQLLYQQFIINLPHSASDMKDCNIIRHTTINT